MDRPIIISEEQAFIATVVRLYEAIEDARTKRVFEYRAIRCEPPSRISFEELDLHIHKIEMLSVHKTLQWRGLNSRLGCYAQKARVVALAGICELIKDEFVGKFWNVYRQVIGWDNGWGPDSTVYDWIWEKGFEEEGVELVHSQWHGRREFVQSLVLESGVPKHRTKELIEFFTIYWRYLSDRADIEEIISSVNSGEFYLGGIPAQERNRLISICQNSADFSKAFSLVVSKLTKIFRFVEDCDDIVSDTIENYVELITQKTGIHPLDVIRDQDQLRKLYGLILGLISPQKLRRILDAKPPGTQIRASNGKLVRTDDYTDIMLGEHLLDGARFTCVPTISLQLSDLDHLPLDKVVSLNSKILLKSKSEITAFINGQIRPDLVRKYYSNSDSCSPLFVGYIFFIEQLPTTIISLRTSNGIVETTVRAIDGFSCTPYLHYSGKLQKNIHSLALVVPSIRLFSSAHSCRQIQIVSDVNDQPLASLSTDQDGLAYCSERFFFLRKPAPKEITIQAIDEHVGSIVDVNGKKAEKKVLLGQVMLFATYAHYQITSVKKGKQIPFGGKKFTLFSSLSPEETHIFNLEITDSCTLGDYSVSILSWKDRTKPCSVLVGSGEDPLQWSFEKHLDFSLYLNNKSQLSPHGVSFSGKQASSLDDFELVINPVPTESNSKDLFWSIVVNGSTPSRVPFTNDPSWTVDGRSVKLTGKDLRKLVFPSLVSIAATGNACIELSLCILDNLLSTVKFWVFPYLDIIVPNDLKEGDEFYVWVMLEGNQQQKVILRDIRGRSRIRHMFSFDDGVWKYSNRKYEGQLELESLGATVEINAEPLMAGFKFGNRESGKVEPVRDVFRRELRNYDLLDFNNDINMPTTFVSFDKVDFTFSEIGKMKVAAMCTLPKIVKDEQLVEVISGRAKISFVVRYRAAALDVEINDRVVNNQIHGSFSYRGPEKSFFEFKILQVLREGKEEHVRDFSVNCDGDEHLDQLIIIPLSEKQIEEEQNLIVRLNIYKRQGAGFRHEYGESWQVSPEFATGIENYDYLKNKAVTAFGDGNFFMAKQCLDRASSFVIDSERAWFREINKKVNFGILKTSISSITIQTSGVLRKEYLFESHCFVKTLLHKKSSVIRSKG